MFEQLKARRRQGMRTMSYPDGPPPSLPERFAGLPVVSPASPEAAAAAAGACPFGALGLGPSGGLRLDLGHCLFCRACREALPASPVRFGGGHQLAARNREDLVRVPGRDAAPAAFRGALAARFGRSFKLRQVSAGGCNACEADANVLTTLAWDLGRFGIDFTASPRHADGLLVTGPVTLNMREALLRTYDAVPDPKAVIAVGACAIGGGPYRGCPEVCGGVGELLPVDLYVPGCPPHPLTLFDGLLRLLGRLPDPL